MMSKSSRDSDRDPKFIRVLNVVAMGFLAIVLVTVGVGLGVAVVALLPDRTPVPVAQPAPKTHQTPEPVISLPVAQYREDVVPAPQINPSEPRDLPAWQEFAVPVSVPAHWPKIVVVMDDMGLDAKRTRAVESLPGPLTLSYLTYAPELAYQAARGRTAGHELLAHVPMQPDDPSIDPGPGVLRVDQTPAQIRAALVAYLEDWSGYVGVNNHMGSRFTAHAPSMTAVMDELSRRGLIWLDSYTTGGSMGPETAGQFGVPWRTRDIFIDHDDNAEAIQAQLAQIEALARRQGQVIAIGHPRARTIAALKAWLPTLQGKKLALVPLTSLFPK